MEDKIIKPDVLTPEDTLEPVSSTEVQPVASTAGNGQLPIAQAPTTMVVDDQPDASEPVYSGFKDRFFRRTLIISSILIFFILLMVGTAFVIQKVNNSKKTKNPNEISQQSVSLQNASQAGTNGVAPLRVGIDTLQVNGDVSTKGILRISNGKNYVELNADSLTNNQTFRFPDSSGTVCLDSNNCGYATQGQLQGATVVAGSGIAVAGNTVVNNGVLAINGQRGSLSLQGTTNQVTVGVNAGQLVLGLPQDIGTGSTPTFAGINLSSALSVASGGTGASSFGQGGVLIGNGASPITAVTAAGDGLCFISDTVNGPSFQACPGGGSPGTVSVSSSGTPNTLAKFTGSQTIANSTITDDGTTVTVAAILVPDSIDTPIIQSSGTLSIGASGQTTVGATNQILALQGNGNSTFTANSGGFTSILGFTTPTGNRTINLPNESGTICLQNSGNCGFALSGSGVASVNGLTGALSVANASGSGVTITIDDASTSQKGIAQFNNTNFSAASGVINTIQGISTSASPQFTGLSLTGDLTMGTSGIIFANNLQHTANGNDISIDAGADNITFSNNSGANTFIFPTTGGVGQVICTTGVSCASGGGQAVLLEPGSAQTASANTNSIHINKTGGTGNLLQLQTGGTDALVIDASGNTTIKSATVSNTLTVNTITPSGALTVGATGQAFTLQGNGSSVVTATGGGFLTSIGFAIGSGGTAPTGNITYQFRNDNTVSPGTYDVCTTAGNCAGGGSGVTTGGGTAGRIAKFTSGTAIDDSIISESGSTITIAGSEVIQGSSGLTIGTGAVLGVASFRDGSSAFSATLQPTTLSGNRTLTIPNASGTLAVSASGPLVLNSTTGDLSCPTCSIAGSGVTSLNGLTGALSVANASGSGATITIDDASTSQKGIAQFNSTNFSASSGTINTIQNIATTASPTFQNMTLQGSTGLTIGTSSNLGQLAFRDGTVSGFSATFSPATLTGNRAITIPNAAGTLAVSATGNINLSAAGQISIVNNPTFTTSVTTPLLQSTGALSITPGGALTVGATSQALTLQGNGSTVLTATSGGNTTTVSFATPTGARSIVLPNESGTVCLQNSVNCGFGVGTGSAFVNNGNSFGGLATLGTIDNQNLNIMTNSVVRMRFTNTGFVGINDSSPGNNFSVNGPSTNDALASTILTAASGSNKALVVQASTSQTANLQEWQSSGGSTLLAVSPSGDLRVHSGVGVYATIATTGSNGGLNITTAGSGSILINPDGNLSLGTVNTGSITVGRAATDVPISVRGTTTFQNVTTTNVAVTIKGASGQTGNLQEWQSNGATVLLDVTANGALQAGVASGTNAAGRDLVLESGQSTGNASGGNINLQISKPGTSGSSSNSYNTVASLNGTTGAALFQNATNAINAFQIQNSAGTNELNVNNLTTNNNLFPNPDFESNINSTATHTGGTGNVLSHVTPATGVTPSTAQFGTHVLQFTTGVIANQGVQFHSNLAPSTTYAISFWAARTGSSAGNWNIGRSENGSDTDCLTGQTFTTTWTQFTCSFTTGSTTNSAANFYIKQTDTSADTVYIDGVTLVTGSTALAYTRAATALQVEPYYNNIVINAFNNTELQPWQLNANTLTAARSGAGVVAENGYIYVAGGGTGVDGATGSSTVTAAPVNADGSVGSFTATNSLGTAVYGAGGVSANGYMYMIGGKNTGGTAITTVQYAKLNANGTTSAWGTTTVLPVATFSPAVWTANGYVYVAGGNTGSSDVTSVYYAKIGNDGKLGSWTTSASSLITGVEATRGIAMNGYVYIIGGDASNGTTPNPDYQYASLNSDGTTSAWTRVQNVFPGAVSRGDMAIASMNGYIYMIGGWDGSNHFNTVYYTHQLAGGLLGTFTLASNTLPLPSTGLEQAKAVAVNGYLYVVGGDNGTSALTSVYYSSAPRIKAAGSLDLVGISDGGTLNGNGGGSLTAGNATFVGSLTVSGQSYLNGGLNVIGNTGIYNSSGTQILGVDTTTQTTTLQGTNSNATTGSELVTSQAFNNGTFWTCGAGWTTGASSATHTTGTATCAATSSNLTVVSGSSYVVSYTVAGASGGSKVTASIGGASGQGLAVNGTQTVVLTATNTNALTFTPETGFNGTLSAVSVKLVTGSSSILTVKPSDGLNPLEMRVNSGGTVNLFIGESSGRFNSGGLNLGLGAGSLQNNTAGNANVGLGGSALASNTTGSVNVALGAFNLANNTIGSNNTALGGGFLLASLSNNTTGSNNTGVGVQALSSNTTGSNNTALGYRAGTLDTDGFSSTGTNSNSTALGANAQVQQSNSLILGGAGSDAVKVGIGTTVPENTLTVSGVMYSTGTASQSTTTVTGVGTTWTASMVGSTFVFANGSKGTITGFTDATHLTLNTSQTVASQVYRIQYPGLQVASTGHLGLNTLTLANLFNINTLTTADSLAQGAISTGSATNKGLIVQGVSGQSANLQEWQTSTGTAVASIGATGAALFQNSTNSTGAFQVQNSGGSSLFTIDTLNNNASILGNNSGALKNWTTNGSSGLPARDCHATVYASGYAYVLGGNNNGTVSDQVYYARVNADGSMGDWATSSNPLPATRDCFTATYSNGYIFVTAGYASIPTTAQDTVWSAKVNLDGTTSAWSTLTTMPFKRSGHQTVSYNGYLYVLGGWDETTTGGDDVIYAKIYANGTIGSWSSTTSLPTTGRTHSGATIANGYIYIVGGMVGSNSDVLYAKLNIDGTIGSWTADSDTLPGNRGFLTATVNNGYLYAIGGNDSVVDNDTVFYAPLNADGSIGAFTTDTSVLPAVRNGHTTITANGYIYVIAGYNGGSTSTVYYASGARTKLGGSLDLVGLSGEYLSEGGSGGSITAGNGIFVGSLQVQGSAAFGQDLSIAGNLTTSGSALISGNTIINGSTLLQNSVNSTTGFDVRSAAGNSILQVDTSGSRVGINLGVGSNQLASGKQGLDINGALRLGGGGSGNSAIDLFTTPTGASVETKINIPLYDPGNSSQLIALGLPAGSSTSARAISVFDGRTGNHQASIGVFSPDEESILGFTWNGSNSNASVSTNDIGNGTSSSAGVTLASGSTTAGTGLTTGNITIQSGAGAGTNTSSGNITIDSGVKTGSGTTGTISVGVSNASAITIGHTGVTTTINGTLVAGVATFTGTFTVQGHIISGNVSGTTSVSVGAGAGTGASASISGNDTAGVITINTGTGAAAGDLGTITFGTSYGAAPTVVITPKAIPGGGIYPQYQFDSATGTFTLKSFNALTDSSTYTFSYQIIQ